MGKVGKEPPESGYNSNHRHRQETGFNNSCLYAGGGRGGGLNREGPREFDCARFVVESTDRIWNMYRGMHCLVAMFDKDFLLAMFDKALTLICMLKPLLWFLFEYNAKRNQLSTMAFSM